MNETKICVLCGDTRQTALAYYLAQNGYETAVWGIPLPDGTTLPPFEGVRCADPESAVTGSRVVILPLPATTDGVRVHSPALAHEDVSMRREIRLTHLIASLSGDVLLLAGRPGEVLRSMARDANIRLIDYYDSEAVQVKNAVPTAEGALALAMEALPITIHGARCTVLGYGRIGRRMSQILYALGARVTVAARSERDLSSAAISGCTALSLYDFLLTPGRPDVIFNTIPVPLLTEEILARLPPGTVYVELASAPGGIAAEAETRCAQRIIKAPSLPGKVAPYTAGRILFETIVEILESEGIRA